MPKLKSILAFALSLLVLALVTPRSYSQDSMPNTIRLGMRTTVPPIASVREEGPSSVWSGFCHEFGQQLERELQQTNPGLIVEYRRIVNDYIGSQYPRWGSLITDSVNDRLDMQCGPNSRQAIEDGKIIFSNADFYNTGIKLLMKEEVAQRYLPERKRTNLLSSVDQIKQMQLKIGAIAGTTTLDRLRSAGFSTYSYETREEILELLDDNLIDAFASDGIILQVAFLDGIQGDRPYSERGYTIFPEGDGYLQGLSENYAIAISNVGSNSDYSGRLLNITNSILEQPRFKIEEREKLKQYELSGISPTPSPFRWSRLVFFLSSIAIGGGISLYQKYRNKRKKDNGLPDLARNKNPGDIHIGSLTINNFNLSSDLTQAAPQIQHSIDYLKQKGFDEYKAQEKVAEDLAEKALEEPEMREKLLKWGQSLASSTVSDVVKEVVRIAVRSLGIPLP